MPSGLDAVTAQANAAFRQAANIVEHMLGQALQLDAAHPKHITIAQDMARALHYVFSHYSLKTTSLLPMVLSAGAELQEHLDPSFSKVVSMPVWTNVHPDDPCCKNSPLYPLTIGYGQPATPATDTADPSAAPATGSSAKARGKQKVAPDEEPEEDRGRQLERGKHSRPCTMSTSTTPKAKHTHAKSKSKAVITSDDDLELDSAAAAAPQSTLAPAKPLKGVLKRTRESIPNPVSEKGPSYLQTDELEEEPMIVGPAPRMGTPYVEIPPAPKFSAKAASPANGLQEDLKADSTSLVWSPACGGCVQRQLICCQGYNANQEPLVVCAWCHRTKHKCGGKGSAAPTKSRKPAARSRSRHRASTVNVTINSDDEASSTGNVAAATITAATPATTATTATTAAAPATTTTPSTPTPATTPATMHVPAPDSQTVLALGGGGGGGLAVLQTMVASLVERVGTSEQLLQEANAKLLTNQVAALQQMVNPTTAKSPAAEPLPVVIRTDAAETLAAATTQPEDDLPTAVTAPQEDEVLAATTAPPVDEVLAQQDESPAVVTTMNVDESAPPQVAGEQELASIASTAH
ncbi:hypothetical protein EDB19DRAFT_1831595 [Suillus lakei]|nr:hypothetical protein EDB19DRAFT_1831595 [Suillus lakei]